MNSGDTAWLLTSAALVLLMTPGLALFYGGMVKSKSVVNMMMMSFAAMAVVGVVWVLIGYSVAFGTHQLAGGLLGSPLQYFGLTASSGQAAGLAAVNPLAPTIPAYVFAAFQMTFAIISVALISGAVADRTKFSTWMVFSGIWVAAVYCPLAHMVWGGGLLGADGPLGTLFGVAPMDFAGGTVVHMNAGMAGLVLAVVIGKGHGFGAGIKPHNRPLVMLGSGLLWFGWFGFNAGSAFAADTTAGLAWINTCAAPCAAILGWLIVERLRDGCSTSIGAASGAVAGLVGITPAAGFVSPAGAIALGALTGAVCALATGLKFRYGFDDSLDVVGVHLVGGLTGTVLVGVFSTTTGLFYGHGAGQLVVQLLVAAAAIVFTGIVTAIIAIALKWTMGWRVPAHHEVHGIDLSVHRESAYEFADAPPARGRG